MCYDSKRKRPPEEPLDYSAQSGAIASYQKEYDTDAPQSHDGRALTRTKFYAEEGNDNIDYDRLAKINDGMYSKKSKQRKQAAERRRDLDAFCSTLQLKSRDKERCFYILNKIEDVRRYESDEVLLLSIVTIVANENERMIRQEEAFDEICKSCNVSRKQIRTARKKLRDKL